MFIVVTGCSVSETPSGPVVNDNGNEAPSSAERKIQITNGVKHLVPLEKILSGGPPKDGIPSIDNPQFESVTDADTYLNDAGLGIAVSFNGIDRFYPNQILNWHEIVNDEIGDQPLLVTYCPLCGTGIVFDPVIEGKRVEFGTSGKLFNSNLVMYDRETDSYWSQILGQAVVGPRTGMKLQLLPHQNVQWKDWKAAHPNGQVLSRDTGHSRNYTRSPYGDYENNREIFFPVDFESDEYHPKAPGWGLEINGEHKIYLLEELDKAAANEDEDDVEFIDLSFGPNGMKITYDPDTRAVQFFDAATGEEIIGSFGFWFSWYSVHPDTKVFTPEL